MVEGRAKKAHFSRGTCTIIAGVPTLLEPGDEYHMSPWPGRFRVARGCTCAGLPDYAMKFFICCSPKLNDWMNTRIGKNLTRVARAPSVVLVGCSTSVGAESNNSARLYFLSLWSLTRVSGSAILAPSCPCQAALGTAKPDPAPPEASHVPLVPLRKVPCLTYRPLKWWCRGCPC